MTTMATQEVVTMATQEVVTMAIQVVVTAGSGYHMQVVVTTCR